MSFLSELEEEVARVRARKKPVSSFHQGYGLLMEEVEEFWDEVKKKEAKRDLKNMHTELIQIAALCLRISEDMGICPK